MLEIQETLSRVLGRKGIGENEKADILAQDGSKIIFTGSQKIVRFTKKCYCR